MRAIWNGFIMFFVACSLCSCASTSLKETWRNPAVQAHRIHRVAVVSFGKTDPSRRVYEDVIASELNKKGVHAVPGYTLIPGEGKMDWATLEAALRTGAAEAVLTMQTLKVQQQTVIQPGYTSTYPGFWYPSAFPSWSLYDYYGASMYYEPPYVSTYELATLQVNLFEVKSGKLIWAATLENSDPGKVIEVSKDVARIVSEALAKEGLI